VPDTSQCEPALLGRTDLFKIAHPAVRLKAVHSENGQGSTFPYGTLLITEVFSMNDTILIQYRCGRAGSDSLLMPLASRFAQDRASFAFPQRIVDHLLPPYLAARCNRSGRLAMLAAIRRALSRVSIFAARRPLRHFRSSSSFARWVRLRSFRYSAIAPKISFLTFSIVRSSRC
jgi:hypothetical protein